MLFLRTGLPGAGKTLNTIKEIDEEHQPDPKNPAVRLYKDPDHPELPPRTIYFYGIPEVKTDKLKSKWVEFETPEKWFDLPDGSIIVIDEAQRVFGTDVRQRVEKVTRFETHRHQGLDIHVITQHPSLIAAPVRKLVGKHINFIRPYGRTKGVFRHEYEMCVDSPEKRTNFKMAQESKIEFDPQYFGLYKSSTVHTHKKVTPSYMKLIPLFMLVILVPLGIVGYLFWHVMHKGEAEKERINAEAAAHAQTPGGEPVAQAPVAVAGNVVKTAPAKAESPEAYMSDYKPRVPDVAASAPRYDELTKPRDFPRPMCVYSTDPALVSSSKARGIGVGYYNGQPTSCQCYSQQMSRLQTSLEFCMDVAQHGYFDDTKQQPALATSKGLSSKSIEPAANTQARSVRSASAPRSADDSHVVVVADGEYASRPWH